MHSCILTSCIMAIHEYYHFMQSSTHLTISHLVRPFTTGFPCNITEDLCNFLYCCCYQCWIACNGVSCSKLGLGKKGYTPQHRATMYGQFNGFWTLDAGPSGWKFHPGMLYKTLAMSCAFDKAPLAGQTDSKGAMATSSGTASPLLAGMTMLPSSGIFVFPCL